eukprot:m.31534 g.31534  ORF g.31534 m.31534 type:complete len:867 (+) comp31511_c0_seq11:260-2860(+)
MRSSRKFGRGASRTSYYQADDDHEESRSAQSYNSTLGSLSHPHRQLKEVPCSLSRDTKSAQMSSDEPKMLSCHSNDSSRLRANSDDSRKLTYLVIKVEEEVKVRGDDSAFVLIATHYFKSTGLRHFLCEKEYGVPSVKKLIFNVMNLPWEDEKKAELIEKILRDMPPNKPVYADLANEMAVFRKSLTDEDVSSCCIGIQCHSKRAPASLDRQKASMTKPFRIIGRHIGHDWLSLFHSLGMSESFMADLEKQSCTPIEEKCYNGLTKWMNSMGERATLGHVQEALKDSERQDIVDLLSTKLDSERFSSSPSVGTVSAPTPPRKTPSKLKIPPIFLRHESSLSPKQQAKPPVSGFRNAARLTSNQAKRDPGSEKWSGRKSSVLARHTETTGDCCNTKRRDQKSPPKTLTANERDGNPSPTHKLKPTSPAHEQFHLEVVSTGFSEKPASLEWADNVLDGSLSDDHGFPITTFLELADSDLPTKRHIQIIAVGQMQSGKTLSIDRVLGKISTPLDRPNKGAVGHPIGDSTTDEIVTYTRKLQLRNVLQLSFTDTPGLGDSNEKFSDDEICSAVKRAIIDDAEVVVLYFARADESQNRMHITSIEKLQKTLGRNIDGVVFTHATTKPKLACSWEDHASHIQKKWTEGKLRKEFFEEMNRKAKFVDEESFCDFENSRLWSKSSREQILRLFCRQERHRGKKEWFRKNLNRPDLPVLKLENREERRDQSARYGICKFHAGLAEMLSNFSKLLFAILTSQEAVESRSTLSFVVTITSILSGSQSEGFSTEVYLTLTSGGDVNKGVFSASHRHFIVGDKTRQKLFTQELENYRLVARLVCVLTAFDARSFCRYLPMDKKELHHKVGYSDIGFQIS